MPPLSYYEQQWVRITRQVLGVKAPTRRSGMSKRLARRSGMQGQEKTQEGLQEGSELVLLPKDPEGSGRCVTSNQSLMADVPPKHQYG